MALLDFLKKKEEVSAAAKAKADREKAKVKSENKTEKISSVKKEEKRVVKEEKVKPSKSKSVKGFSYEVIREPHVSEKGTMLSENNQYVFKVSPRSNKQEIKKSVEGIYGVNVLSVNIIKIPPKKRRLGKTEGFRKKYQKAVVTIKEGQKIEIL